MSVAQVHTSGEMYRRIGEQLPRYVHKNEGLLDYLQFLVDNKKELFVVTNSPFSFMWVKQFFNKKDSETME